MLVALVSFLIAANDSKLTGNSQRMDDTLSSSFLFVRDIRYYEKRLSESNLSNNNLNMDTTSCANCVNSLKRNVLQCELRSPVKEWVKDIREQTESECLSALQAKSVAVEPEALEALSIRNAQICIYKLRYLSVDVIDSLDFLIDKLPLSKEDLQSYGIAFNTVCEKICEVIELCRRRGCDFSPYKRSKVSTAVSTICQQIIELLNDFQAKRVVNNAQLEAYLRKLKERLGELVNLTIQRDCQVISDSLLNSSSHLCLKWSLLALWQLTQNDAYICRIFTEMPKVILRLINIFSNNRSPSKYQANLKAASLRVLSYLCINPEAIVQIYELMDFKRDLIAKLENEKNETVLREASALIVQLTTPFIDLKRISNKDNEVAQLISKIPIPSLIKMLTDISSYTNSTEVFLLISASLANVSFLETDAFIYYETLWILLLKLKQKLNFNQLSIRDQMITIIANVSSKFPLEVVNSGGLMFLMSALQLQPMLGMQSENDLNSIERMQQKVAAALARLGNQRSVATLIYRLNGVHRLIELCKDPKERNFSDTVLLASLAALRRISNVIGKTAFKELNALDLIDLNFRDSFVLYSSKNESYV